jgi:hypothetical protein
LELVLKILIERPTSETCLRFGFGFEQPEAGYARFQIFLTPKEQRPKMALL